MSKNHSYFCVFISKADDAFSLVSHSSDILSAKKDTLKDVGYICSSIRFIESGATVSAINEMINGRDMLRINHIANLHELDIYGAIMTDRFKPFDAWTAFLNEKGLLCKWIAGELKVVKAQSYQERSKAFGYRCKYTEDEYLLDNHKKIWSGLTYFEGHHYDRHGDYSKFYYKQETRFVFVERIPLNQAWREDVKFNVGL